MTVREIEVHLPGEDQRRRNRTAAAVVIAILALLVMSKARTNPPPPPPPPQRPTHETVSSTAPPPPPQPPAQSAAHLAAVPASLTFPPQLTGAASVPQLVHIRNDGDVPLTVQRVAAMRDAAFRASNDCTTPLRKSESCSAAVVFAADASGPRHGTLVIETDGGSAAVDLHGTTSAVPAVDLGSVEFGSAVVGQTSEPPRFVRFLNSGAIPIALGATTADPPFAAGETCARRVIPPGGNCVVPVTFRPASLGVAAGALRLFDTHRNVVAHSTLSGTGIAVLVEQPKIAIDPLSIRFYGQKWRDVVTITNTGSVPLRLNIRPEQKPRGYEVDARACEGRLELMPGKRCQVIVIATETALRTGETMHLLVDYPGGSAVTAVTAAR